MERQAKLIGLDASSKMRADFNVTANEKTFYDYQKLSMDEMLLARKLLAKAHAPNNPDRSER